MKKLIFIFVMFLAAALVFGGGSNQPAGAAQKSQMDGRVKGSLPLSDGSVTFSVFMGGLSNFVTSFDYADNAMTKKLTDETGIKLDIIASSTTDANTRRNVLFSSGDYPDLVLGNYISRDFMTTYANEGILIPLDEYNPTDYPRIKALWEEYPSVYSVIRGSDGKIHALPAINDCQHCVDDGARVFSYMPWLRDNYNNKIPTNLDEFITYLRYVRDNDINGNGDKNDEIPFLFRGDQQRRPIALFAKMFMPFVTGPDWGYTMENGNVIAQYKDPRFREALKVMNQLYRENLIYHDSFSTNANQLIALVESEFPTVAMMVGQHLSGMTYGTGERRIDYNLMQVLAGPTGLRYGSNNHPWWVVNLGLFITDKCKDPALAIAMYDYLLRTDVALGTYIGLKGEAWDDADPGTLGINGQPALYKYLITWNGPDQKVNMGWNQQGTFPQSLSFRLGEQAMGFDIVKRWMQTGDPSLRNQILNNPSYFETHNYLSLEGRRELWMPIDVFVPPFTANVVDTAKLADINTPLNSFIDQACAQFITGDRDINNEAAWNAYLQELDRMGAAEKVSIIQKYVSR